MNNTQLNKEIIQIEQLITDTKSSLKSWANLIGKYHAQMKALAQQLDTIKKELNMKNNNNLTKNQGGNN